MHLNLTSKFFAPISVFFCLAIWYIIFALLRLHLGPFDPEINGVVDAFTYVFYGFSFAVLIMTYKDFKNRSLVLNYTCILFLWTAALFREMGIQHWLTTHDTTAIKMRFFMNSENPLSEKIIAGVLVLSVLAVAIFMLCRYLKKIILGFFHGQSLYWSIVTFGALGFTTQLADRLPSRYRKITGEHLSEPILFILKIFEECGESLLPLVFAIALIQFHLNKTTCQSVGAPKDIVQDSV